MKCRHIEKLLAEGLPLTGEAEKHLKECTGCQALLEALTTATSALNQIPTRPISTAVLPGFTKVKPLPPDTVLISITLCIFFLFCLVLTAFFGFGGLLRLTLPQRLVYYGAITFFGLMFSMAAVQTAVPGAKVRVRSQIMVASAVVILAALVTALFPDFDLDRFVDRGFPCLRFGCMCAALFSGLATIFLRRGYVTDIRSTSLLLGCFAGFSGVAVLSLHCPILNAPHIIVWHLGAIGISALGGFIVGWFLLRKT
jgi:hypothetical protein